MSSTTVPAAAAGDTVLAVARAESAGMQPLPATGTRVRLAWRPEDAVPLSSG